MEHLMDLNRLFSGEVKEIFDTFVMDVTKVTDDITEGKATINAAASNHAGSVDLELRIALEYETECSRCLKKLNIKNTIEKSVPVCLALSDDDNDEYVITENGIVDLASIVCDIIVLESPSKIVCSEDCKGLCFKCGADLNKGECGCVRKEIDPRLAKLKELL